MLPFNLIDQLFGNNAMFFADFFCLLFGHILFLILVWTAVIVDQCFTNDKTVRVWYILERNAVEFEYSSFFFLS